MQLTSESVYYTDVHISVLMNNFLDSEKIGWLRSTKFRNAKKAT